MAGCTLLAVIVVGLCGVIWRVNDYWERSAREHDMDCNSSPTPFVGCTRNGVPTFAKQPD
jgi:hypothetical protein